MALALLMTSLGEPMITLAATPQKIAVIMLNPKNERLHGRQKEFVVDLEKRLSKRQHVVPQAVVDQALRTYNNPEDFLWLQNSVTALDAILDEYYSFKSDENQTAFRLKKLVSEWQSATHVFEKFSELMTGAILLQGSLEFEAGQKDKAAATLEKLVLFKPVSDWHLDEFPTRFCQFLSKQKEKTFPVLVPLKITSSPAGAAVYVDKIQVGHAPLVLSVPPGTHEVALSANGRRAFREIRNFKNGQSQNIKARLRWQGLKKGASTKASRWVTLSLAQKLSVAQGVARSAQVERVVFVRAEGGKSQLVVGEVYDATHSQLYKPNSNINEIVKFISRKTPAAWMDDVQQDLMPDHCVAARRVRHFYEKPAFWIGVGGVVVAGGVLGVTLVSGGAAAPAAGSIVIGLGGL